LHSGAIAIHKIAAVRKAGSVCGGLPVIAIAQFCLWAKVVNVFGYAVLKAAVYYACRHVV
jgi:hypothetical protein